MGKYSRVQTDTQVFDIKLRSEVIREVTSNGKLEFVPRDQVSSLLFVHCSLFLHLN